MKKILFVALLALLIPSTADAERLFSSGCELQGDVGGNMTDHLEWERGGTSADTTQVSMSVKRSGLSSCEIVRATNGSGQIVHQFSGAGTGADMYFRFYTRFAVLPASTSTIMYLEQAGDGTNRAGMTIDNLGRLAWYDGNDGYIGGLSSALSINTWYRIEVNYDALADFAVRVDGTTVLSGSHTNGNIGDFTLELCWHGDPTGSCNAGAGAIAELYFDDIAINDANGTAQNSWPGAGSIVHMQPDGAGDNSGCTAGTWASVDEITPDDASTICTLVTDGGGDIIDSTVESASSAGIDSYDTVNLVQVGAREAAASAAAESWNLRIKSASGGTTSNGSTATHNDTTYRTNGDAAPRNYSLTSYTDPTTAVAWTPTGTNSLDNMQIGANSVDAAPDINLSTLWALAEYIDGAAPGATDKMRARLNSGRIKVQGGRFKLQSN